MTKLKKRSRDTVKVRGFFRVQIIDDPSGKKKIVGDSGWRLNTVVNLGFDQYLCQTLAGMAGSKTVSHAALGTGTAPAAADTSLSGEITHGASARKTVSPSTIASKTAQFTAAFGSASFLTTTVTLQNVGLFNTSTTGGGTIFAGNTYATSQVASNQQVNMTYQIRFS